MSFFKRGRKDEQNVDVYHHLLEGVFKSNYHKLVNIAYGYTKDWHTAEDVAQDAFAKAIKKIDELNLEKGIERWLVVITIHTAIDYLRQRKLSTPVEHLDAIIPANSIESDVEHQVMQIFSADKLNFSLHHLPPTYQQVIVLHYYHDMKVQDIAEQLQMNVNTVKSHLIRARKLLKKHLSGELPEREGEKSEIQSSR
jgi:RNA polymerase sigma-70 factor (ECF subfamily)